MAWLHGGVPTGEPLNALRMAAEQAGPHSGVVNLKVHDGQENWRRAVDGGVGEHRGGVREGPIQRPHRDLGRAEPGDGQPKSDVARIIGGSAYRNRLRMSLVLRSKARL